MPLTALNLNGFSTAGESTMANFREELAYFEQWFKKVQPAEKALWRWLYLSPQQRIERLRELMLPVSEKKS